MINFRIGKPSLFNGPKYRTGFGDGGRNRITRFKDILPWIKARFVDKDVVYPSEVVVLAADGTDDGTTQFVTLDGTSATVDFQLADIDEYSVAKFINVLNITNAVKIVADASDTINTAADLTVSVGSYIIAPDRTTDDWVLVQTP